MRIREYMLDYFINLLDDATDFQRASAKEPCHSVMRYGTQRIHWLGKNRKKIDRVDC